MLENEAVGISCFINGHGEKCKMEEINAEVATTTVTSGFHQGLLD